MKLKHLMSLIVFACISCSLFAQHKTPENNVKINLVGLGYSNFSFQYERILGEKISASMGMRFMLPHALPTMVTGRDTSGGTINSTRLSGICFTPEFRFYPATEKGAPHGFYLAPYIRYSRFKVTLDDKFVDNNNLTSKVTFTGKYSGFGGGLMIGYQWLINDRVTIDWWILGLHYGTSKFSMSTDHNFSTYTEAEKTLTKEEFESDLEDFPMATDVNATITNKSATVSAHLPFVGLRVGLCIGVVF